MSSVLLDTNAVLLHLAGNVHPQWLGQKKPISNFSQAEFEGLQSEISKHTEILTLPNILTEVSNLIGIGKRTTATEQLVTSFVEFVQIARELSVDSSQIVTEPIFARFGLTDLAVIRLITTDAQFITSDFGLYGKLIDLGARAVNIRHFVDLNIGSS